MHTRCDPQVYKLEQYLQRRCTTARHGIHKKDTKHRGTEAEKLLMHFKLLVFINYYKTHGDSLNIALKRWGQ